MPFRSSKSGEPTNGKGKKLTAKMVEFVDLFMVHKNATKAVEESSYQTKQPGRIATELLRHPLIVAEIDRRLKVQSEKMGKVAEVKAEYLITKLMAIIEKEQEVNPQAALRAIELAGKSIALWKERQEISGPDGEAIRHEQQVKESVADFTSRISGLAKRAGTDNVLEFPQRSGEGGA